MVGKMFSVLWNMRKTIDDDEKPDHNLGLHAKILNLHRNKPQKVSVPESFCASF